MINNQFMIATKKHCICLAAIVDSVCKIKNEDDKYYSQIFLEVCQYEEKKPQEKKRRIKEKRLILDSNEHDESDDDESIK